MIILQNSTTVRARISWWVSGNKVSAAAGDMRLLLIGDFVWLFVQGFDFFFESIEIFCCFHDVFSFLLLLPNNTPHRRKCNKISVKNSVKIL